MSNDRKVPFDSASEYDEAENVDKMQTDPSNRHTEIRPLVRNSFGFGSHVSPSFNSN